MDLPYQRLEDTSGKSTRKLTSSIVKFFTVASLASYSSGGFAGILWVSAFLTHGPTSVHEIVRGIELYAYHPDEDIHQRNIQFLGGQLCIPIDGEDKPTRHHACHAPTSRENHIKLQKPTCC